MKLRRSGDEVSQDTSVEIAEENDIEVTVKGTESVLPKIDW